MKVNEKVIAVVSAELLAFSIATLEGVFEFGLLGVKTFFIAVIGGLGGMFGKWIWNKIFKKNGKV